jgi:CHAT domain-containing protein
VEAEFKSIATVCKGAYTVGVLAQPTAESVLTKLPIIDIVHFACYSFSDALDPSNSHLLLQRHGETGLVVDKLSMLHIVETVTEGQTQLAFLSACSTADVKAHTLVGEGLHLVARFQVASFSHVIGSFWSMNDDVSARLAALFYLLSGWIGLDGKFSVD